MSDRRLGAWLSFIIALCVGTLAYMDWYTGQGERALMGAVATAIYLGAAIYGARSENR